ncbi:hypothetical protein QFZ28_002657 [Neobacillus niacini]|uniref:hypothetical protein n=1 Tax=Neobacillus niacini TaxID=86668 RepID=UPI002786D159|nr:hypothetical protein [Neobacillus niacini]MDQ1002257.1 hypothetical protein [Neobacillus niacini]
MYGDTIGILLSKKEWMKLMEQEEQHKTCAYQYSRSGNDLGMEVAFFLSPIFLY